MKVLLNGGLGNQMFQYAFAKSYEIKHSKKVELDITFIMHRIKSPLPNMGDLQLDLFKTTLPYTEGSPARFKHLLPKMLFKTKRTVLSPFYIREKLHIYSSDFLENKKAVYAEGYFQTEKYFAEVRPAILHDFTPKFALDARNQAISDQIKSQNSISIHVRRGDYVKIGAQLCGTEYYENALQTITEKFPNPTLFVFSDDIAWVKENLKTPYKTEYIDHNKDKDSYKDMILMSQCKHNVIANSSFSWWGAWLNQNPEKIVIAPLKWYDSNNSPKNDIYAKGWIVL